MGGRTSKNKHSFKYAGLMSNVDQDRSLFEVIKDDSMLQPFLSWLDENNHEIPGVLIQLIKNIDIAITDIRNDKNDACVIVQGLWQQFFGESASNSESLFKALGSVESSLNKLSRYSTMSSSNSIGLKYDITTCLNTVREEAFLMVQDCYNEFLDEAAFVQTGVSYPSLCGLVTLSPRKRSHILDLIAYFICGLINNFGYVVMLSAADHIGGKLPEAAVLLADILPTFIIKLTAPFFMDKIPYNFRITAAIFFGLVSFQLVAWGPNSSIKIIGVVCASISSGLGEVTFLALSSFYHRNVVSAWSSGTGAAGIVGATWYLAFTAWFTFINEAKRPFYAMIFCSAMPLFMAIAYFIMMSPLPSSNKNGSSSINRDESDMALSEETIIDPIAVTSQRISDENMAPLSLESSILDLPETQPELKLKEKAKMIPSLLWYILPLILVYFGEYLINQGVDPSLVWPGTKISCQEYRYYQFLYQGGVFISRSSVNFFRIKNIWWLPLFQIVNLNLLTYQAIWNFIPYYWIVFIVVVFEGLLGGATYVNVFYAISTDTSGKLREYSMSLVSVSDSVGISAAALSGLWLGPFLKNLNFHRIRSGNCPTH